MLLHFETRSSQFPNLGKKKFHFLTPNVKIRGRIAAMSEPEGRLIIVCCRWNGGCFRFTVYFLHF